VDGSGLRWVTHGTYPSWSPDGSRLTLTDGSVFVVDVNGSNRQEIFDDQGYLAFGAVWSPDGRRIAFHVGTFSDIFIEILGLWTVNADGSGAERPLVGAWAPAWSPDSSEIAFVTWSGIGVARADGSGERLPVVAGEIANVDWAPNGNLVYSRWITGSHEGPARIFISDGHERQLIPDASAPARQVYRDFQVAWRR
jgi:Tol biopolymer transport system component